MDTGSRRRNGYHFLLLVLFLAVIEHILTNKQKGFGLKMLKTFAVRVAWNRSIGQSQPSNVQVLLYNAL